MIKKILLGPVFLSIVFTIGIITLGDFVGRPLEAALYFVTFFLLSRYFTTKNKTLKSLGSLLIFPILFTCFIAINMRVPKMYF